MVFQNPDNQCATTVEEDVAFGPKILVWIPAQSGQVDEALN